jgi:predicted nuclease with RNAse H fold
MYKGWNPAEEVAQVEIYPAVTKRKKLRLIRRQSSRSTNEKATKEIILDGVLHELQNCLQSIGMGIDLLQLTQPDGLECRTINLGLERASRLLR